MRVNGDFNSECGKRGWAPRLQGKSRMIQSLLYRSARWTSSRRNRFVCGLVALSAMMGVACPAQAQTASFDCRQARQPVEQAICAEARLRWLDFSLLRDYRAALVHARDEFTRADLRDDQRNWLAQRNLLFTESTPNHAGSDALHGFYLARLSELQDRAAPPIMPLHVSTVDDRALAIARPELDLPRAAAIYAGTQLHDHGRTVHGAQFSPDGSLLAVALVSAQADFPDQVWLYRLRDQLFVAATPAPDFNSGRGIVQALAWEGDHTLLVQLAGTRESFVYAADMTHHRLLAAPTAHQRKLLDESATSDFSAAAPIRADDGADVLLARRNGQWAIWLENRSGTITLKFRARRPNAPSQALAWGSWSLQNYVFDTEQSQVIFPADTGIARYDLNRRMLRRIGTTRPGDTPLASHPEQALLAWLSSSPCQTDSTAVATRQFLCVARLPPTSTSAR